MTTLNLQVGASLDDGLHRLDLGMCFGVGGFLCGYGASVDILSAARFALAIPQGSTIDAAFFKVDGITTSGTSPQFLELFCEDADDAVDFTAPCDIDGRARTTAVTKLQWTPPAWDPDFNIHLCIAPLQEVVDRAGWASGNHAVVVLHGDPDHPAVTMLVIGSSYDSSPALAPKLDIDFTAPPFKTIRLRGRDDTTIRVRGRDDATVRIRGRDDATLRIRGRDDATIRKRGRDDTTIHIKGGA